MKRVAVVGAGLGGLSAAIHLALAGFAVDVFEQAADPGGRVGQRRLGPFRFDTGPSLVTLPAVWDELFAAAGRRCEDSFKLTRLDPVAEYFWPSVRLTAPGTPEGLARAFAAKGWAPETQSNAWFQHAQALWHAAGPLFQRHSLQDRGFWNRALASARLRGRRFDTGRTFEEAIGQRFESPQVRQIFGRHAASLGSDQRRLPATFALVPWTEFGLGVWTVNQGIQAVPRSMHRLAVELGVKFRFSTPVKAIVHERGRVKGLRIHRELVPFDAVVSNVETGPTYRLLATGGELGLRHRRGQERGRRGEMSSSRVVFLWGIDTEFEELGRHNVFFSARPEDELQSLFSDRRLPVDPTVSVTITSKSSRGDAPPGQENWMVTVNAPHDPGPERIVDSWAVERLQEATLRRIETNLGRVVRSHIVQDAVMTPADFEAATGAPGGSLGGFASHRPLAAFDRPSNRMPGFRGLYLCGAGVHPGPGMALSVLSGRNAADLAASDSPPH